MESVQTKRYRSDSSGCTVSGCSGLIVRCLTRLWRNKRRRAALFGPFSGAVKRTVFMMIDFLKALPNVGIRTFRKDVYPSILSLYSHHRTPRPFDRSTNKPKQSVAQPLIPPLSWQAPHYSTRTSRHRTTTAASSERLCLHQTKWLQ